MRIITKDKKINIPYENSAFEITKQCIPSSLLFSKTDQHWYILQAYTCQESFLLGAYTTEETAIAELEAIHQACLNHEETYTTHG